MDQTTDHRGLALEGGTFEFYVKFRHDSGCAMQVADMTRVGTEVWTLRGVYQPNRMTRTWRPSRRPRRGNPRSKITCNFSKRVTLVLSPATEVKPGVRFRRILLKNCLLRGLGGADSLWLVGDWVYADDGGTSERAGSPVL